MSTGALVGVMAVLAIVCVYFWLVRKRDQAPQSIAGAGPEHK